MATTGDGKTKEYEIGYITTTQIVEKLEEYKHDNTEFFYLYVSTARDDEEKPVPMETDPPSLPEAALPHQYSESRTLPIFYSITEPSAPPDDAPKKIREKMMDKVHKEILPKVLAPLGWRKVCDKDMTSTYRALYFNIIPKDEDEDDDKYIRRVSQVRSMLADEADKLKKTESKFKVNFKINSLLSKPFRYY